MISQLKLYELKKWKEQLLLIMENQMEVRGGIQPWIWLLINKKVAKQPNAFILNFLFIVHVETKHLKLQMILIGFGKNKFH